MDISAEELNKKLDEIEQLHDQVDRILHHPNPIYRWWFHGKAERLHEKAKKLYRDLNKIDWSEVMDGVH